MNKDPWSQDEIDFLMKHIDARIPVLYTQYRSAFPHSTRTKTAVERARQRYRENPPETRKPSIQLPPPLALPKADSKDGVVWLQSVLAAASEMGMPSASKTIPKTKKSSLVVLLSDLHFGKKTPRFTLEEARRRLLSIPHAIRNNTSQKIDEVVLVLGGDLVEGEGIYATQGAHIECSVFDQVRYASKVIWECVAMFQRVFQAQIRVEMVPGNHGRVSNFVSEISNWDNMVGLILNTMASVNKEPGLCVNFNAEEFLTFGVKDKIILLTHKGVKHTGTPAMKIRLANWAHMADYDILLHGHWHEWKVGTWADRWIMANGSLCGPDDYSTRHALVNAARQGYFFVTPEKPLHGFGFVEWT